MIVAIEGMDGAGKTTICNHIEKKYKFINIDKPTKFLYEDEKGRIDYKTYYETLEMIYKTNQMTRSKFFGQGNYIAVTRYPNSNIVLDRHLASNYYWNGNPKLYSYYEKLISLCGKPDITIYLYATPKIRYQRLKQRNWKDLDLKDSTIFEDGTEKHIEFLNHFNFNYQIINTNSKTIREVCREIDSIMNKLIAEEQKQRKKIMA